MALFGSRRDVLLVKSINKELVGKIIEQNCGYYKPKLDQTNINIYGESTKKTWIGPVLLQCLIQRDNANWKITDQGIPDVAKIFEFRFIKDDLIDSNVLAEVGDVILWRDDYFEVHMVNENRLFVGKDNEYNYSDSVVNFGASLHVVCTAHYSRKEKLGIDLDRI